MKKAELLLLKANVRFTEKLRAKGIVYDTSDDMPWNYRIENDMSEKFVAVCGDFLITVWYSAVLDPEYRIHDRKSWELIATQATLPDGMLFGSGNKWWSFFVEKAEEANS